MITHNKFVNERPSDWTALFSSAIGIGAYCAHRLARANSVT